MMTSPFSIKLPFIVQFDFPVQVLQGFLDIFLTAFQVVPFVNQDLTACCAGRIALLEEFHVSRQAVDGNAGSAHTFDEGDGVAVFLGIIADAVLIARDMADESDFFVVAQRVRRKMELFTDIFYLQSNPSLPLLYWLEWSSSQ
mgnify:FL=1